VTKKTPNEIIDILAKHHHVPLALMTTNTPVEPARDARYIAAHVMRQLGYPYSAITHALGWADRKSVQRAVGIVKKRSADSGYFKERVEAAEKACGVWG